MAKIIMALKKTEPTIRPNIIGGMGKIIAVIKIIEISIKSINKFFIKNIPPCVLLYILQNN